MKAVRDACAIVLLICLCATGAAAEVVISEPTLIIGFTVSGLEGDKTMLPLDTVRDGTWAWVAVPGHVPVQDLSLSYEPSVFEYLQVAHTFDSFDSQTLDLNHLDFTQSATQPYAFRVLQRGSGQVLRSGWLTVSYYPRPADLPEVPSPVSPTPVPTETVPPTPEPTPVPTIPPTQVPTPIPTLLPTPDPTPVPTYMPPAQTGYGMIMSPSTLWETPNGVTVGTLQAGTVVYVEGQYYGQNGTVWHRVTLQASRGAGYVLSATLRFMTQQEINDYFNPPTPLPTFRPTPTPSPVRGYVRMTRSTTLRRAPGDNAGYVAALIAGDVAYVMGDGQDVYGAQWLYAQVAGVYGYIRSTHVVRMTAQEIADYLNSLRPTPVPTPRPTPIPTPRPTAAPTLNPDRQYAVVKMDNVNFRRSPGGTAFRRLSKGTMVEILDGPSWQDGYGWYRVQVGEEIGYLREDMLNFIQIAPTATPRPTAPPIVWPTPTPLPTAPPLSLQDRIRASADTVRYTEYARSVPEAVSYAVADFDSDKLGELLLVIPYTRTDGTNALRLDAFKWTDNEMRRVARREIAPVLTRGTELSVNLVEQAGRIVVYVMQGTSGSLAQAGGQGLTLVDSGWLTLSVQRDAPVLKAVLHAVANARGVVTYEDLSELHPQGQGSVKEQETAAYAALLQVFLQSLSLPAQGNG